jgi:hypothetical protein
VTFEGHLNEEVCRNMYQGIWPGDKKIKNRSWKIYDGHISLGVFGAKGGENRIFRYSTTFY